MRVAIVTPPTLKPSEPGLSGAAAVSRLRGMGVEAMWIDGSAEWHRFALAPERLQRNLEAASDVPDGRRKAFRRAVDAGEGDELVLQHLVMDLDFLQAAEQGAAQEDVVEHLRAAVMEHGEATVGGERAFDRRQHAVRQMAGAGIVLAGAGEPQGRVVILGVEVAGDGDEGVRFGIEDALDREA